MSEFNMPPGVSTRDIPGQGDGEMWVYVRSKPGLFTVGFYDFNGDWQTDSGHNSREAAAERVAYLNGCRESAEIANLRHKLHVAETDRDRYARRSDAARDARLLLCEAQKLRPALLAQLGYVPECVLDFCNKARKLT
jgi:hypothetical protein